MPESSDFYGISLNGAPAGSAPTESLLSVFETLKPQRSATPLMRIGGDADGSYLVPDILNGVSACFSPGVNSIKHFEDALADGYGIRSHMCDFTCDVGDLETPLKAGLQTFEKKWLDPTSGDDSVALQDWVSSREPAGDLILQMDIEGAEYRNLLATPDETMSRFRVVVLELHSLQRMLDRAVMSRAVAPLVEKTSAQFIAVHAHPNNCCGDFALPGTDIRVPRVLELTLVRRDWFRPAAGPALLPHPHDVGRNVRRRAPLFLGDAWCDGERPVESRVKILEDTLAYRDDAAGGAPDVELDAALTLTMDCLDTLSTLLPPRHQSSLAVADREVAHGRPFTLSSSFGSLPRTGVVASSATYFFHTDFGPSQWIEVDLGQQRRIVRIEVVNRRDGHQERATHLFARLVPADRDQPPHVFPVVGGDVEHDKPWHERGVPLPCVPARYVKLTSPIRTALHLADLRVYAVADGEDADGSAPATPLTARLRRRTRAMGLPDAVQRPRGWLSTLGASRRR